MATMTRPRCAALIGSLLLGGIGCASAAPPEPEWPDTTIEPTIAVRSWDTRSSNQENSDISSADTFARYPSEALRIDAHVLDRAGIPRVSALVSQLGVRYELTIDQLSYRTDPHTEGAIPVAVDSGFGVRLRARV